MATIIHEEMSPKFHTVSLNASELSETSPLSASPLFKSMIRGNPVVNDESQQLLDRFQHISHEHASRIYLQSYLLQMETPSLQEMTSPKDPELVPNFTLQSQNEVQLTSSMTVEFQQREKDIPIFGSKAVIEIDQSAKSLVSIEATLAEKPDISPVARLSPFEALEQIRKFGKLESLSDTTVSSPSVVFFADMVTAKWRLAYYFTNVPAFPPEFTNQGDEDESDNTHQFCVGNSPRHYSSFHDYFVDAHSGDVFYYFSSTPRLDIPVACIGQDDQQIDRSFYGLQNGHGVSLSDPLRNIQTYDFTLQDIDNPTSSFPNQPIRHTSPNFSAVHPAAVSAHYNATLVYDFYNHELKRNGIDDKGMVLESVVNVYSSRSNPLPSPTWGNAVWWNKKMWYGQKTDSAGTPLSFARYLDVIGHELTHGVTETTSNLIYRDLSGALNESFSDIFGIFIKNWYPGSPNPISTWNWEMGPGLGRSGGPIRNFSNPTACGQPDHFSQYRPLPITHDSGGVHIYSGIHNLAAYHVLTAKNADGDFVFHPSEVAILYYLTLTRLTRFSVFTDCRRTLLNVAGVYYAGDPQNRTQKQGVITMAYNEVGIN